MSSPHDCSNSEEQKNIAPDDKTGTKCDSQREGQPLPASDQQEVSSNKELVREDINVDNKERSDILNKGKSTPAGKEKCSSGSSDMSSAKKKRAPCPWQIHPPPRPFKKARFAWQIKNYEHTISRMKKAVAQQQQQQQHHEQTCQTSSYNRSSVPGNDVSDDPGEVTRPLPPGSTHYPGIYSNLQTTYPSNFYNNPLMRWSKIAASTVDSPVNRMLHNLFFSGNEPPPDLHSLLMLSLAEGNAAALTENMNCEDLPSNLPVEALSAALSMPQSQLHQQSALHSSSNLSSPGMQSPPTSDYDSSSDDASLGDDIVPEPQVLPPHLPPSLYQQHLQHAAGDDGQHHPSYGPGGPQQCQANCPGGACPLYSQQDCDLQSAIPASRKLFLQHQQNIEQSHLNSPENTNANMMFQNAMMNCPIGITNRNFFNFQLQSFCERMQASNALLPFPTYQQHFPLNSAHLSEYMDSQDEDGDYSPAELQLRRNFSPSGGDVEPTPVEKADAEHDDVDHSQERVVLVDVVASQPPANGTDGEEVVTGSDAVGAGGAQHGSRNTVSDNHTDDTVEEPRMVKGDRAIEDGVVAANNPSVDSVASAPQVFAVDNVTSGNAPYSCVVAGTPDQDSDLSTPSEDEPVCVAGNEATTKVNLLSLVDGAPLTVTYDHSTSETSDQLVRANKMTAVTSSGSDSQCDGKDGTIIYKAKDGSQASSVETSDEARAESVLSAESGRTGAVPNGKNSLANKSQPDETVLPASPEDKSGTCVSSSVCGEGDLKKPDEVSSSTVNKCSASSDCSVVAPVSLTVGSIVDIGDSTGSSDAAADSFSLKLSGQTLEGRAHVVSPAIRCSSEYSREGNSPTSSLALKPKIGRNDCEFDSTEDTFSPSSFSSNSKCLNCVNGCDNCSNNLRDSSSTTTTTTTITTESTTAKTLGSPLGGNTTTTTSTTRSCSSAGRVTVVTCSCVIAKNRASDPPIVVTRNVVSLANTDSNGPPALPVIRGSSAATANSAVGGRKEASPDVQRQPTGERALWKEVEEDNSSFAGNNNGDGLVVYPSNREHWHGNMEEDEEELVEGEYDDDDDDDDDDDGPPPTKKLCIECSSFETCSTGGLTSGTACDGDIHLGNLQIPHSGNRNNDGRCQAGCVGTADLQHVAQNTGTDDGTAVRTPPPPLTAPVLNDDEDPVAAGTTTTTTAAAVVHHMCDNNNDKYFLDQAFHLAIKQGLGYQKA